MTSRYDPAPEEPKSVDAEPTQSPLEPPSKAALYKTIAAIGLSLAIAIAAALHFDLCGFLAGVGVTLTSCHAAPAAAAP